MPPPPPSESSPLLGTDPQAAYNGQSAVHTAPSKPTDSNGILNNDVESAAINGGSREQDPDVPTIPGVPLSMVIPAMAIGIFMSAMDNTIVVASYGRIGTELNELNRTSWISTAYLLTATSFQPLYGRLSDIFGRKACLLFSYTAFGIGCLLCGFSRNMNELIAARAFAGVGGGGMTTVASILLSDIVALRTRGTWQGILNIIFAIGSATGGPLGGWLSDVVGWRWAFWGQVPLTFIAFAAVLLSLHLPVTPTKPSNSDDTGDLIVQSRLKRVDFPGALALVLAVFAFLLSLDLSTNSVTYHLTSPFTLSIFVLSLLLFTAFYYIEGFYSAEPFCPPGLVKRREILSPCLANFFCFASAMGALFHIPLFSQAVQGTNAATAGKRLLPMMIGSMFGSLGGGIYMQKTGRYYWLTFTAYLSLLTGISVIFAAIALAGETMSHYTAVMVMYVGMIMYSVGIGIGVTSTLIALISNVTTAEQAVVTAVSYLFRSLGSVLGLSVSAGLVQSGLKRRLLHALGDGKEVEMIVRKVRRDLDFIGELKPEVASIVRKCYQGAIVDTMGFAVFMGLLCWVLSWWIREVKVKK
ncbi:putative MFS multidrug transporter [Kalaharituber pfeilii]|nr:putative MFS multidrug transporter [Kalaharituber pfeilii]